MKTIKLKLLTVIALLAFFCLLIGTAYAVAPVSSDLSASTTVAGQSVTLTCKWAAQGGASVANISSYIFGTDNTGHWVNETGVKFTTFVVANTTAWANVTLTWNSTSGYTKHVEWWANDTSNVWANTGEIAVVLTTGSGTTSTAAAHAGWQAFLTIVFIATGILGFIPLAIIVIWFSKFQFDTKTMTAIFFGYIVFIIMLLLLYLFLSAVTDVA